MLINGNLAIMTKTAVQHQCVSCLRTRTHQCGCCTSAYQVFVSGTGGEGHGEPLIVCCLQSCSTSMTGMTACESAFEASHQLFASARLYFLELVTDAELSTRPADLPEGGSEIRSRPAATLSASGTSSTAAWPSRRASGRCVGTPPGPELRVRATLRTP
eukprot:216939-Alexandrium_andersonii.AAC.1